MYWPRNLPAQSVDAEKMMFYTPTRRAIAKYSALCEPEYLPGTASSAAGNRDAPFCPPPWPRWRLDRLREPAQISCEHHRKDLRCTLFPRNPFLLTHTLR